MAKKLVVLATLAMLVGFTGLAHADSITDWYLTGTNSPGQLPCSLAAPCAEVALDINNAGTNATFTVTSLLNGWVFDKFGFNTGGALVNLVSASGEVGSYSLGGSGNEDGWGTFDYNFLTGKHGGSSGGDCSGNPGSPSGGCTFMFTLSGTSLSLSTFEHASSGGTGSGFFAGHEASNSNSGYSGSPQEFIPVSEPAMLMILTPGLLTAAGLLTRRFSS
jgi:hypothetical protein